MHREVFKERQRAREQSLAVRHRSDAMSESVREALLRSAMLLVTIPGAIYVFYVIYSFREGSASPTLGITALLVVISLVVLNRWWYQRTGTRI
jgi:isoprenylcysteine carboxyl methyltransferase (ICMT) family protein YpbQ